MRKMFQKALAQTAKKIAVSSAQTTSCVLIYQPKTPAALKKKSSK
ncbi:MAG: cyclic lactone autoinducer peptide [Ruminococcus sp.]